MIIDNDAGLVQLFGCSSKCNVSDSSKLKLNLRESRLSDGESE